MITTINISTNIEHQCVIDSRKQHYPTNTKIIIISRNCSKINMLPDVSTLLFIVFLISEHGCEAPKCRAIYLFCCSFCSAIFANIKQFGFFFFKIQLELLSLMSAHGRFRQKVSIKASQYHFLKNTICCEIYKRKLNS